MRRPRRYRRRRSRLEASGRIPRVPRTACDSHEHWRRSAAHYENHDHGGLPRGSPRRPHENQAHLSEMHRPAPHGHGACAESTVSRTRRPLTEHDRGLNRVRSSIRGRGEDAFHVVKRLWGLTKARHRGLAKNAARLDGLCTGRSVSGQATIAAGVEDVSTRVANQCSRNHEASADRLGRVFPDPISLLSPSITAQAPRSH